MNELLAWVLTPLLDHGLELAGTAVALLGARAVAKAGDYLKLRADSEVRAYLTKGLELAVEYGKAEARRRVSALAPEATANVQLETARAYVQDRFPDALKRFGVDTAALDKMLQARLPPPRQFGG